MDLTDWTQTVAHLRLCLWVANVLIYGCVAWRYLRATDTDEPHPCPVCGSRTDIFCTGGHSKATPAADRRHATAAGGYSLTAGRLG